MNPKYYTLQIVYNLVNTSGSKVEERKDLHPDGTPESIWIRSIREKLFASGFQVNTSPTTIEFIAPYRIREVFLILQPGKFAID